MFCTKCGEEVDDDVLFCSECGNKFEHIASVNQSEQQVESVEIPVAQPVVEPVPIQPAMEPISDQQIPSSNKNVEKSKEVKPSRGKSNGKYKVLLVILFVLVGGVGYLVWDASNTAKLEEEQYEVTIDKMEEYLETAQNCMTIGDYEGASLAYAKAESVNDANQSIDVAIAFSEYYKVVGDNQRAQEKIDEEIRELTDAIKVVTSEIEGEETTDTWDKIMQMLDPLIGNGERLENKQLRLQGDLEDLLSYQEELVAIIQEEIRVAEEEARVAEEEARIAAEEAYRAEMESAWNRAYEYIIEGKISEAIATFEMLIAYDSMDYNYYRGLAEAYITIGYFNTATRILQEAISMIGPNDAFHTRIAEIQFNTANNLLGEIVTRVPYDN
ncbi:MAG: zinc ribbon domain-containing protein [Eubacteriales bacterium]